FGNQLSLANIQNSRNFLEVNRSVFILQRFLALRIDFMQHPNFTVFAWNRTLPFSDNRLSSSKFSWILCDLLQYGLLYPVFHSIASEEILQAFHGTAYWLRHIGN